MTKQNPKRLVIVGTGLAGYTLAREIRRYANADVLSLVLLSADGGALYAKPVLSTALAFGKTAENLIQKTAAAMETELSAAIHTHTTVSHIDGTTKQVVCENGDCYAFDDLVLAVGAAQRPVPVTRHADIPVYTVNDLDDFSVWEKAVSDAKTVLVIGAGLIGCEFADDLLRLGKTVHLVDPAPQPLSGFVPPDIAAALQSAFGTCAQWHLNTTVTTIKRRAGRLHVAMACGTTIQVDIVLSAIGLIANTAIAKAAGIDTAYGIVVDRYLRTSMAHVYAIGDCAQMPQGVLPYVQPLRFACRALAQTLTQSKEVPCVLPVLPIKIKTALLPLMVCPPHKSQRGTWTYTDSNGGVVARYTDEKERLFGFALTGAAQTHTNALLDEIAGATES